MLLNSQLSKSGKSDNSFLLLALHSHPSERTGRFPSDAACCSEERSPMNQLNRRVSSFQFPVPLILTPFPRPFACSPAVYCSRWPKAGRIFLLRNPKKVLRIHTMDSIPCYTHREFGRRSRLCAGALASWRRPPKEHPPLFFRRQRTN